MKDDNNMTVIEAFDRLDSLKESTRSPIRIDFDVDEKDWDYSRGTGEATVLYRVWNVDAVEDEAAEILVEVKGDFSEDDIEWEWEPDGEATYVPYGEQSVLYDDGKGGVESAELERVDFEVTETYMENSNGRFDKTATTEDCLRILKITEEEFNSLCNTLQAQAFDEVKEEIENELVKDSSNWPEGHPDEYWDW